MTNKDKDKEVTKEIKHPELLKSLQELSLTLNLLKSLASDLKHKLEETPSTYPAQNTREKKHINDSHSTLH